MANDRIVTVVVGVVALAVGVCGGMVAARPSADAQNPTPVAEKAKATARIADVGEKASLEALRARIRELEKALAAASASDEKVAPQPEPSRAEVVAGVEREARPRSGGPQEWMENLRKADPERFAQVTNRMAQFRNEHFKRTSNRLDLLASVDTSRWSKEARETHAKYMDLMAKREELMAQNLAQLDGETMRKSWQEGMQLTRQIHELEKTERESLLRETARGYGLGEADAEDFAATVQNVVDVTSDFGGMRGRHGGPHNRPHGGGER